MEEDSAASEGPFLGETDPVLGSTFDLSSWQEMKDLLSVSDSTQSPASPFKAINSEDWTLDLPREESILLLLPPPPPKRKRPPRKDRRGLKISLQNKENSNVVFCGSKNFIIRAKTIHSRENETLISSLPRRRTVNILKRQRLKEDGKKGDVVSGTATLLESGNWVPRDAVRSVFVVDSSSNASSA